MKWPGKQSWLFCGVVRNLEGSVGSGGCRETTDEAVPDRGVAEDVRE
jgi:hypothetical protein